MTDSGLLLAEIEKLFHMIRKYSRGVNHGPPDKKIAMTIDDLKKCDMLEIENYKGFNIRVIIKKIK